MRNFHVLLSGGGVNGEKTTYNYYVYAPNIACALVTAIANARMSDVEHLAILALINDNISPEIIEEETP